MKKVLAIVGPTASGKTGLSVDLAKKMNGEIISADSRQVYRYVSIATAQPSEEMLNQVKHHYIGELELGEKFNAGEFGKSGRQIIEKIFLSGKQPIICGGSGLYIKSLIDGLFEEEIESSEAREELYELLEKYGEEYLYNELKKVDRETYLRIPKGKIRRVIRALEVYRATGEKISQLHKKTAEISFETIQIGLMLDRKYLYERINCRVDEMMEKGLLREVRALSEAGFSYKTHNSLNTVGVKEVFKFFEGEYDELQMLRLIKQNSRRYAKRQMTWFRKDKRINWINVYENSATDELAAKSIEIFKDKK